MFYAWISVNHACFIATWCGRLMQILCRLCGAKVIIYSNICPYTSVSSIPCIKRTCISRKLMHGTHMDFQTHTYNRYIDCACIACTHTYYAQYMHGSTIPCTCAVNNLWPRNESACVCSSQNLNVLWMAYDMGKLQVLKVLCIIGPAHGSTHCISAKSKVSIWTLLELIWLNKMWWLQTWQFFTTHFCA